ncbi:MAG: glycoside hydrolase family 3 N-terminal domain-containing protein [Janthinobacterium lividum]
MLYLQETNQDTQNTDMIKPIIFGLSGSKLTREETVFFQENKVVGFILFRRNIESKEQILQLTADLKELHPHQDVKVFVDQEGGRVARLKPPIADKEYPTMDFFGKIFDSEGEEKACLEISNNFSNITKMLKQFGIDSGCSPVADLNYPYTHRIIGDRSFGSDVQKVVKSCLASIKAIEENGGIAIMKHIPGHGRAITDSHLSLPKVSTSLEDLNSTDFAVFKQLSENRNIAYAMTAHVVFEAIDPELPATLSKKVINFIRAELGFKGKLMTDDICMRALHQNIDLTKAEDLAHSIGNVTKLALEAGCDIILHCNGDMLQMQTVVQAVDEILNLGEISDIS